jgi:hypothetical protein
MSYHGTHLVESGEHRVAEALAGAVWEAWRFGQSQRPERIDLIPAYHGHRAYR